MKALIAMSGGVDSSVAALLTKQQGYECIGCTMRLFENEDAGIPRSHSCCSLDDVEDARNVAQRLGIPYYVFNFTEGFRETVIDRFVRSYENGITPNPCIDCNRFMKFEALYQRAKVLGCEQLVTGHYARIERHSGGYVLKKAADESKDQSYVLYTLTQEQLAHTQFPLGTLRKSEVRQIAAEHGLFNAEKPDSQDICFVPDGSYVKALERFSGKQYPAGEFLSTDGKVLGRHKGIVCYTVGQRKGLGISSNRPLYVCRICPQDNTVILGGAADLLSPAADVQNFHWIAGTAPTEAFRCSVKIRYRHPEQPAFVYPQNGGKARIVFDAPQRAVTPGQAAVLYDGDTVLGGGEIVSSSGGSGISDLPQTGSE